jgi:hypothetical protein
LLVSIIKSYKEQYFNWKYIYVQLIYMNESINKKFRTGCNLDNKSDMGLSNKIVKDATEQFDKEWSQIITIF